MYWAFEGKTAVEVIQEKQELSTDDEHGDEDLNPTKNSQKDENNAKVKERHVEEENITKVDEVGRYVAYNLEI